MQVKGVSRPVETYELVGTTSARTRLHAAVARGLTPFVGRKTEIETFQKLVKKVGIRKGQIFAMVGEPGIGKSRLVYEFTPPVTAGLASPRSAIGLLWQGNPLFPGHRNAPPLLRNLGKRREENIQEKVVTTY